MHSLMTVPDRIELQQLFQLTPHPQAKFVNQEIPDILIGTAAILGTGLNLTRATVIVQVSAEWLQIEEVQAMKRIYRLGQTEQTFVYRLVCTNLQVEKDIVNRQARRELLQTKSLKAGPSVVMQDFTRREEDYGDELRDTDDDVAV